MSTETSAKCSCNVCNGHIEFDRSRAGEVIQCPHCGMETRLYAPAVEPPSTKAKPENLFSCPDCGATVGRRARACPRCGSSFERTRASHGVFYYVFWGVISLIATMFILGFLGSVLSVGVPSFMAARRIAQSNSAGTNESDSSPQASRRAARSRAEIEAADRAAKAEYIQQFVRVLDFKAAYFDDYDGRIAGVRFRLQNAGNRTLTLVQLTVHFRDSAGKIIAEEKYAPISKDATDGFKPLRPGYFWQLDQGRYYPAKNIPSEWKEGWAQVEVSNVEFEEDAQ